MGNYQECIKVCDHCVFITKDKKEYDRAQLGKALARKGNALLKLGKIDASIETYEKAVIENGNDKIKMGLFNAKKTKEELLDWGKKNMNSKNVLREDGTWG